MSSALEFSNVQYIFHVIHSIRSLFLVRILHTNQEIDYFQFLMVNYQPTFLFHWIQLEKKHFQPLPFLILSFPSSNYPLLSGLLFCSCMDWLTVFLYTKYTSDIEWFNPCALFLITRSIWLVNNFMSREEEEEEECPICLECYKENDPVKILPCKHVFHEECARSWIVNIRGTCPLCKQGIFAKVEDVHLCFMNIMIECIWNAL